MSFGMNDRQGLILQQSQAQLAQMQGALRQIGANLDPESSEAQQLFARQAAIDTIQKGLTMESAQHQLAQTQAALSEIARNVDPESPEALAIAERQLAISAIQLKVGINQLEPGQNQGVSLGRQIAAYG